MNGCNFSFCAVCAGYIGPQPDIVREVSGTDLIAPFGIDAMAVIAGRRFAMKQRVSGGCLGRVMTNPRQAGHIIGQLIDLPGREHLSESWHVAMTAIDDGLMNFV